ncbi:hypothetical protein HYALB_00006303 [Hymenoscyphus albidus]|uniref:Peptidase A1 domain-containing protein n=1 Tax=Hymenoscyphus albidus TaxID=595503 RepID=A0A9N9LZ57_9HELO|nr:hypothetical protein HYALB_00006303 [Hymenoscyphus albidus]
MSTALKGLHKVRIVLNKNYKKSGIKSYAKLLNKWGFEPTQPGPYYQEKSETDAHASFHKFGGSSITSRFLAKKGDDDSAGKVSAEDIQNDSLYLCPVQIGTPAQTLNLDFDTGSADLWVWSTLLDEETLSQGSGHTIFNPDESSTFGTDNRLTWKISYGDGSSASGNVGYDKVTIGGLSIQNQGIELATKLSKQFVRGTGDGLLGLAFGNINTVRPTPVSTPVDNMISEDAIPASAELFTAKLGSWRDANEPDHGESFYTFGYIDDATVKASGQEIHWTPIESAEGFWLFDSTSTVVNGKIIQQSKNIAIADTGTTLALVSDAVCKAIYSAIPGGKYDYRNQGWVYPTNTTVDQLPDVTVAVGNKQFIIQKEDLGFVDIGNGTVYGGIQSRGTLPFDILGDTFLKGVYAIFDQGNKRFGTVQRPEKYQNISPAPQ